MSSWYRVLAWTLVLACSCTATVHADPGRTTPKNDDVLQVWSSWYGISPQLAACVWQKECGGDWRAVGDNGLALGGWQWHLDSWRWARMHMGLDMDDRRLNPEEATRTAMWQMANGYPHWWTAYESCAQETGERVAEEPSTGLLVFAALERVWNNLGFEVRPQTALASLDGLTIFPQQVVFIQPSLPVELKAKVCAHELAHYILRRELRVTTASPAEEEFIAELASYDLAKHFGLDTQDYTIRYVNGLLGALGWTTTTQADAAMENPVIELVERRMISLVEAELVGEVAD